MAFSLIPTAAISLLAVSGALGLAAQTPGDGGETVAVKASAQARADAFDVSRDIAEVRIDAAKIEAEAMREAMRAIDAIVIDREAIGVQIEAALREVDRVRIDKVAIAAQVEAAMRDVERTMIDKDALKAEVAASVREGLAAGAAGMASGAENMLRGADKMERYADRLRDPAFRRSEVARINSEDGGRWKNGAKRPMTEQDLIDSIPKLKNGAVKMREGAKKMRARAAKMRDGRSD